MTFAYGSMMWVRALPCSYAWASEAAVWSRLMRQLGSAADFAPNWYISYVARSGKTERCQRNV